MNKMLAAVLCLGMVGSANMFADLVEDILKTNDAVVILKEDQLTSTVLNDKIIKPLDEATKVISDSKIAYTIKLDAAGKIYEPLMLIKAIVKNLATIIETIGKTLEILPGGRSSKTIAKGNAFGAKMKEVAQNVGSDKGVAGQLEKVANIGKNLTGIKVEIEKMISGGLTAAPVAQAA